MLAESVGTQVLGHTGKLTSMGVISAFFALAEWCEGCRSCRPVSFHGWMPKPPDVKPPPAPTAAAARGDANGG